MIKIILAILMLSAGTLSCVAQSTDTSKAIQAGWGDLNYAVPESPAFKILGTSPSDIMRPTSVRNIAFSTGNYFISNGGTIPQNLAVEISPALFNPRVSLNDFKKNRFWYTSAFSIGSKMNQDKSYAIGLGFKIRLWDKQDLRTNTILIKKFDEYGPPLLDAYRNAVRRIAMEMLNKDKTRKKSFETCLQETEKALKDTSDQLHNEVQKECSAIIGKSFNTDRISELRDSIKKANWNKLIVDLGAAVLFNSKDSLLRDIQPASKLGLWATAGFPIIGQKGQLLIGVTGQLKDTVNSRFGIKTLNLGSRAYYGSNDIKGFIEADTFFANTQKSTLKASAGIETTFFGGMWLDFFLGLSKQTSAKAIFTQGLTISFANGEKKKPGM